MVADRAFPGSFSGARPDVLSDALDDDVLVTVLRAPVGFGKTAAVTAWARQRRDRDGDVVAWCDLDDADDDVVALHDKVAAAFGGAQGAPGPVGPEWTSGPPDLAATLGELVRGLPAPVWLVLDNLERLRSREVLAGVERLLTAMPPGLRLVICTRAERPIGLRRLRITGRLREIGVADLVLTPADTERMAAAHGVHLDHEQLATLHRVTAGWPAATRLAIEAIAAATAAAAIDTAAAAIDTAPDLAAVLEDVAGHHPPAADFLDRHVLGELPPAQRHLLHCTSVPDEFDTGLATQLTGDPGAPDVLAELERTDLVLLRRDDARYRQPYFLRTHLLNRLRKAAPARLRQLHGIAARWSADNDALPAAARHARRSEDPGLIAALVATHGPELLLQGETACVFELVRFAAARAPVDLEVGLVRVLAELMEGGGLDARKHLTRLAGAVENSAESRVHELDAVVRSHWSQVNWRAVPEQNRLGARLSAMSDESLLVMTLVNRGITSFWLGRQEAEHDLRLALTIAQRRNLRVAILQCKCYLGGFAFLRGDLLEARRLTQEGLALAKELRSPAGSGVAYCLAGWTAFQAMDENAAADWTSQARAAMGSGDYAILAFWATSLEAAVEEGAGTDVPGALIRLREHRRRLAERGAPMPPVLVAHVALQEQRLALRAGRLAWAVEVQQSAATVLGAVGETHMLRARVHLHQDQLQVAHRLLDQITDPATPTYFVTTTIEAHLHAAGIALRSGDEGRAVARLRAAAELAAPGRVLRPFQEAGDEVRRLLLSQVGRAGRLDPFLQELLASAPGRAEAVELTDREAELLKELASLATVDEIAERLTVSPNTVKTHLRNIYRKLGVRSRRAAVSAGRRHGLI